MEWWSGGVVEWWGGGVVGWWGGGAVGWCRDDERAGVCDVEPKPYPMTYRSLPLEMLSATAADDVSTNTPCAPTTPHDALAAVLSTPAMVS